METKIINFSNNSRYTLYEYNNQEIRDKSDYNELHTCEIFTILPELYIYSFVTTLTISIGKKAHMLNYELLLNENINPCPTIKKINIFTNIKLSSNITSKLFGLFPNLTHLFIDTYPGNNNTRFRSIDISAINKNIKKLSLHSTLDDVNINFICSLKNIEHLSIYMSKPFTDTQLNKLMNSFENKLMMLEIHKGCGIFNAGCINYGPYYAND